ncbi:MAG: DUF1631 family protein [Sedimenticola sp.]
MERRKHARLATQHPATFTTPNGKSVNCVVSNFSCGGLFLIFNKDPNLDKSSSGPCRVNLPQDTGEGDGDLSATVNPVFFGGTGLGVSFVESNFDFIRELIDYRKLGRQKDTTDEQPSLDQGQPQNIQVAPIIAEIRDVAVAYLEEKYPLFIEKTKESLFEAADKAASNTDQSDLFFALSAIEKKGDSARKDLLENIRHGFGNLLSHHSSNTITPPFEMDLVDKEEFDEWVLVVSTTTPVEQQFLQELCLLERCFSYLSKRHIHKEINPVSPYFLLWSYDHAIQSTDIPLGAKQVIFQCFSETVLSELEAFYLQLSDLLEAHGIIDRIQSTTFPASPTTDREQRPQVNKARRRGVVETLSDLVGINRKPRKSVDGFSTENSASDEAVLDALDNLPKNMTGSVARQLENRLSETSGGTTHLPLETRQSIEATASFVSSVREDTVLTNELNQLVAHLEIPLIKGALKDPSLLNTPNHPARKLLDAIAELSPYLSTPGESMGSRNEYMEAIEQITNLTSGGKDLDLDQVTDKIETLLSERKKVYESNLSMVVESSRQTEALNHATDTVRSFITDLLSGKAISPALDSLLRLGWIALLIDTCREFTVQSSEWESNAGMIDTFVHHFDGNAKDRKTDREEVAYIKAVLEVGFGSHALEPNKAAEFIQQAIQALYKADDNYTAMTAGPFVADSAYLEELFAPHTSDREKAAADTSRLEQWKETISSLQVGDWVVQRRSQGEVRLINLAWLNDTRGRFVFVDGSGAKSLDTDSATLATLFNEQALSLLENSELPIVDRAIDRALRKTFNQIKEETGRDQLTGLMSRKAFEREISMLLESAKIDNSTHLLISIDIDQFSVINDACGIKGGDQLLVSAANILRTYMPQGALAGRIGDDEFGLLIESATSHHGHTIAENQRKAMANYRFIWEANTLSFTVSIGIVEITCDGENAKALLMAAASATNMAKRDGRNCTRIYQPTDERFTEHQQLIKSVPIIETALEKNQLTLYSMLIEPIFLEEDTPPHNEVLLRVYDDKGQPSSPVSFIQAAEQYNRMTSVDRWVVNEFFQWLEKRAEQLKPEEHFCLNLSVQSMLDETFGEFLKKKILGSGFPPERLGFEVTETAFARDIDKIKRFINETKALGCRFLLDDFGSGYSSYSYLKELPVDIIKIDGVFVKDMLDDESSHAMVKSITDVAHMMGKQVIAEFVENEAILIELRNLGVDYAQGYGIGQPAKLDSPD